MSNCLRSEMNIQDPRCKCELCERHRKLSESKPKESKTKYPGVPIFRNTQQNALLNQGDGSESRDEVDDEGVSHGKDFQTPIVPYDSETSSAETCQDDKIVILDDNELSLAMYAQEYPENWKKMTESEPNGNSVPQKVAQNDTQQDERARKRKLDSTSNEVRFYASQSTSNKRDMGNPAETRKGCGCLIPLDPSDKNSEGWYCGHYYDSFKAQTFCDKCTANHDFASKGDKQ